MPEQNKATEKSAGTFAAETQKERWMKYGANVVLTSVIVVLLAIGIVYAAQRKAIRTDTTSNGIYSLRP